MSIPSSLTPLFNSGSSGGALQIERSLRFNSSDSGFLSRVPAVAGNRTTWTWSGWVKRSKLSALRQELFRCNTAPLTHFSFSESAQGNPESLIIYSGGSAYLLTTPVFRDVSAWYHITVVFDTTNGTAGDRVKVYVNGSRITTFNTATYPSQNFDTSINTTNLHYIGASGNANEYFDGYLANIHFIDGQALTPSSFTETDATTGQLVPKTYTGSYGTNGFNLLFADNSSNTASTLGKDTSPNGNNWTPNNFSVTAGVGNDSLVDSPTNYGTDTGVGGSVRGNYATLNPLRKAGSHTLSNGNLDIAMGSDASSRTTFATIGVSSGKWYWEGTVNTAANVYYPAFGVDTNPALSPETQSGDAASGFIYLSDGRKFNSLTLSAYGASFTSGDIIGVALNMDAGTITFFKNGSTQGQAFSGITGTATPCVIGNPVTTSPSATFNFGQRAFAYTAPSGFKALCTQNLPAPLVAKSNTVFDITLWTGTGVGSRAITGLNFNPDLVWLKRRSSTGTSNQLHDVVRTASAGALYSDLTNSEDSNYPLTSFDTAGFTLGNSASLIAQLYASQNEVSQTYVGWAWDAGTSTVSNTAGSITSQVRANVSAGFSVATWSSGSGGTVGHGLGVAPSLIIAKARTGASQSIVYHSATGVGGYLYLSATNAVGTNIANVWSPVSSTVFNVNNGLFPTPYDYVSYHFAPVVGYSNGFSYTGNGSADGVFQFLGFRPRLIMLKRSDSTSNWTLLDTSREGYNVDNDPLYPNTSDAEGTADLVDITSNGFKLRTTDASVNASAGTYIGFAWAEMPFNYSRAR